MLEEIKEDLAKVLLSLRHVIFSASEVPVLYELWEIRKWDIYNMQT